MSDNHEAIIAIIRFTPGPQNMYCALHGPLTPLLHYSPLRPYIPSKPPLPFYGPLSRLQPFVSSMALYRQ